jgi:hypothetical protein
VFISILGAIVAVIANVLDILDYYLFYGYITVAVCLWLLGRNQS